MQGPDGDEITFAGQRGIFNNISLDGGDYNNGFFGEQVGGQRAAIDITLEAVKEFQVIATGAPAEFGRTAGGVVNVITKSGTNELHGSLFHFQRLEGPDRRDSPTAPSSTKFHREQFGGTIGGPHQARQGVLLRRRRRHHRQLRAAEPQSPARRDGRARSPNPTIQQNEALINANPDCQRLALLNFFQTRLGQDEGPPIEHPIETVAMLGKLDVVANATNTCRSPGTSTTRAKRTRRSTSPPMARRPTASKATPRASTSST